MKISKNRARPFGRSFFRSKLIVAGMCLSGAIFAAEDPKEASSTGNKGKPTDWHHWRGPMQNGQSLEKGIPDSFKVDGENQLWKKEGFGSYATPIVMNGRLYTICRSNPETTKEAEKTVCLNAETGDLIWESIHNVFLADAPSERIGWSSVIGDPETDKIYALGIGCMLQCLDAKDGKILLERSMLEEYGMLSTYGGRTNFPTLFEDMLIISGVTTGWDQTAVPAHRVIAMDKSTGAAIWTMSTRPRPEDTTFSTPIYTVLNGQAAMVLGAADGAIYALQPRTGKVIWKYQASPRGINVTPLVENGIVYCAHGEQNESDRTILGCIFAFNGNTTGDISEDKLLWKVPGKTIGKSSPVKVGERVYFADDGGFLFGVNAATGVVEIEKKLSRALSASAIVSEGKIYIGDKSATLFSLKPTDSGLDILAKTRINDGGEIYGSCAISNGRLYVPTTKAIYCMGNKDVKVNAEPMPKTLVETATGDATVAHIQICPVELLLSAGQKAKLQVRAYNAAGQYIRNLTDAVITVDGGTISDDLLYTAPTETTGAGVSLTATSGELKSVARARVIAPLPWRFDFEDKKVPIFWIGAAYRHQPAELPTGGNGLVKISTIPKGTRSQAFMGKPNGHNYTVQAEVYAADTKNKVPTTNLPDMGVVNQRYTLSLEGSQKLQIRSWFSMLEQRFAKTIPFEWQAKTWYTMKLQSENKDGKAVLRGKVWKTGEAEPEAWTIEAEDLLPNTVGSPGLFGKSSDAEIYIDNVIVKQNDK